MQCLIYLAKKKEGEWISVQDLSRKLKIPYVFLAKIVQTLVSNNILESRRGKEGGVRLKRKEVKLSQVIAILNPKFSLSRCLKEEFFCFLKNRCPLYQWLSKMEKNLQLELEKVSLLELVK